MLVSDCLKLVDGDWGFDVGAAAAGMLEVGFMRLETEGDALALWASDAL